MPGLSTIISLLQQLGLFERADASSNSLLTPYAVPGRDFIWHEVYAWYPVVPTDEGRIFWLEPVWRRRTKRTAGWEYRSFRDEATKLKELMDREI